MNKKKFVLPENMGNTIVYGAREPKKYDVKFNTSELSLGENGLELSGEVKSKLNALANFNPIENANLLGDKLILTGSGGKRVEVPLGNLAGNSVKPNKGLTVDNTGKIEVKVDAEKGTTITNEGVVGLQLSKAPNNLITLKKDGIYYGIEPPANIKFLYVDALNGVDQDPNKVKGAGSKLMPLRTFKYALELAQSYTNRYIFLKEDQDHIMDTVAIVPEGKLYLSPYGDIWNSLLPQNKYDNFLTEKALVLAGKQPRVVFTGLTKVRYPNNDHWVSEVGRVLRLNMFCSAEIAGVRFIADIGFNETLEYRAGNSNELPITKPYYMKFTNNGIRFIWCEFETRGTPRLSFSGTRNGANEPYKDYATKVTDKPYWALCWFIGYNSAVEFRNVNTTHNWADTDIAVYGFAGWDYPLSNSMSISVRTMNSKDNAEMYKRLVVQTVYTLSSGDKIILAPNIDIPHSEIFK